MTATASSPNHPPGGFRRQNRLGVFRAAIVTEGARIGATPLGANDTQSAVLLMTLQPGVYSFIVKGANNSTGLVLVEVYDAD